MHTAGIALSLSLAMMKSILPRLSSGWSRYGTGCDHFRRPRAAFPPAVLLSRFLSSTTEKGQNKRSVGGPSGGHNATTRQEEIQKLMGSPLQKPAGSLWGSDVVDGAHSYIPEVPLYHGEGGRGDRKRILILCTGGTLTMASDPKQGGALAPVQGAISNYMKDMTELNNLGMPDYVLHEVSYHLWSSWDDWTCHTHLPNYSTLHFETPVTWGLQIGLPSLLISAPTIYTLMDSLS